MSKDASANMLLKTKSTGADFRHITKTCVCLFICKIT